jgi:hypothetical protein
VRAAVVTRIPSITWISSSSIATAHTETPGVRLRLLSMTVAGRRASIHFAPCSAEAENPANTPCPRVRSQHAFARRTAVISVSCAMYTS